jgi:hypothetical protein
MEVPAVLQDVASNSDALNSRFIEAETADHLADLGAVAAIDAAEAAWFEREAWLERHVPGYNPEDCRVLHATADAARSRLLKPAARTLSGPRANTRPRRASRAPRPASRVPQREKSASSDGDPDPEGPIVCLPPLETERASTARSVLARVLVRQALRELGGEQVSDCDMRRKGGRP